VIESFYTKKAIAYHEDKTKLKDALIAKLKAEGREKEISAELAKIDNPKVNRDLAYLEGELLEDYIHDMKIAQEYAYWNRKAMQAEILDALNIKRKDILNSFCTMHNYIDIENKIIRKGAISLQKGEIALIPMNMSDGALIVRGKGNPDWNFSGPHGAGRLMSRTAAKEKLKMEDFKESMKGIYTTSVSVATIDESKMAYKPMQDIIDNIQDTCDIIMRIKPIWNIKASD
jgi:RNA-splicing ligase RtcB